MNKNLFYSISRLINSCIASHDSVSFDCLLSIPYHRNILEILSQKLQQSREPVLKNKILFLYMRYYTEKSNEIDLKDDEFLVAQIITLLKETPVLLGISDLDKIHVFLDLFVKQRHNMSISKLYNQIIQASSNYTGIAVVSISNLNRKLDIYALRYLISNLDDLNLISIVCSRQFFEQRKLIEMNQDAQEEFTKIHAASILQTAIIAALTTNITLRVAAAQLASSLFFFYPLNYAISLANSLQNSFLAQFKESSIELRTCVAEVLANMPVNENNVEVELNSLLPTLASKISEYDDKFTQSMISYVEKRKNVRSLEKLVANMLTIRETSDASFLLYGILGMFENRLDLWKSDNYKGVLMAIMLMSDKGLFSSVTFEPAFQELINLLCSKQFNTDSILQNLVLDALKSVLKVVEKYSTEIGNIILPELPYIEDIKTLEYLLPVVEGCLSNCQIKLSDDSFAKIFVNLFLKYYQPKTDSNSMFLTYLQLLCGRGKENIIKKELLFDIINYFVPAQYIECVRSEALIEMRKTPKAVLIAACLPNCGAFLHTMTSIVRESYPNTPKLTKDFLINTSKNSLDLFLPHLAKFAEVVNVESKMFLGFFARVIEPKPGLHVKEVLSCLDFIGKELSPNLNQIGSLLAILESSFPPAEDPIDVYMPEALDAITAIAKIENQPTWPISLLKKIFSLPVLTTSFPFVLKHTPAETVLVALSVKSFAQSPVDSELFCDALFNVMPQIDALGIILKSMQSYFETQESLPRLEFCLMAAKKWKDEKVLLDLSEFLIKISTFFVSTSPKYRTISRDAILILFKLQLPEDKESIICQASEPLTPVECFDFARSFLMFILKKLTIDFLVDLSIHVCNSQPMTNINALILNCAASTQPEALVKSQKRFVEIFLNSSNLSRREVRVLNYETSQILATKEMNLFLKPMISKRLTEFDIEILTRFVRNQELRASFIASVDENSKSISFPVIANDQHEFLQTGFFKMIEVIIRADDKIEESFGIIISHCLIWLSLIYASSLSTSVLQKLMKPLTESLDYIFIRTAKSNHDPIEFNIKTPQALYQSLGTLANALILVDFKLLINFCKSCFNLLKRNFPPTVLTASMIMSRLLYKVKAFESNKSRDLIKKLKEVVAISFEMNSDQNCRVMTAVMDDIEGFSDEQMKQLLNGSIRSIMMNSDEFQEESLLFLCKLVSSANICVLTDHKDTLWEIINNKPINQATLAAMAKLVLIDHSIEHIKLENLPNMLLIAGGDNNMMASKAKQLFTDLGDNNNYLLSLKQKLGDKFEKLCLSTIAKVNKANLTLQILEMLDNLRELSDKDSEFANKYAVLLLSILEDYENPLRKKVVQLIPRIFVE